jgi:hypothetical protein
VIGGRLLTVVMLLVLLPMLRGAPEMYA